MRSSSLVFPDRRLRRLAVLAAAIALLPACASQRPSLVPAPDAQLASAGGTIALASDAGVTIRVDPDAWRGPVDIESAVTPMHVQIENQSDRKLRIRYDDFSLVADGGERYVALPPYDIRATVTGPAAPAYRASPLDRPAFAWHNFYVAPWYRYWYPSVSVWHGHPFAFDPRYYGTYYPRWERMRVELPTPEMLRYALPEGVLEEGGRVAGFLYFERVVNGTAPGAVAFRANVADIVTDETVAVLEVPFVIRTD